MSAGDLARVLELVDREPFAIFLDTARPGPGERFSYLYRHPVRQLRLAAAAELPAFLAACQEAMDQGLILAGYLAYELGYLLEPALAGLLPASDLPLAELGAFARPEVFDHATGRWQPDSPCPAGPTPAAGEYRITGLAPDLGQEQYTRAVARILDLIAAGDTYQVNYTLKYRFSWTGSAAALYLALRRSQRVAYAGYLRLGARRILSLSPELFFHAAGGRCTVRPMKGTSRRGRDRVEDEGRREALAADPKNRAENVMIVDLLRNDLGRLCVPGGVAVASLFDVETYETLLQMTSTIEGQLRPEVGLAGLLAGLFPCGSVTGAPKIRTMAIIRELEAGPRGVYTGAIGHLSAAGGTMSVPIRTVVLEEGKGEMGVGSGIVADSDPEREWAECQLKAEFLARPHPEFGLVETMLWRPATGFWLLAGHLERLAESAAFFGFPCDRPALEAALQQQVETLAGSQSQRLRLVLAPDGSWRLTAIPLPAGARPAGEPPLVALAGQRVDSTSVFLYHKTTCRKLQDQELARGRERGLFEVIFTNERGEVTEGSFTNLFIRRDDLFLTPPVSSGLLPGVFRRHFLARQGGRARTQVLTPEDLTKAEAVYVGNSVRGLVPVRYCAAGLPLAPARALG
ncbi:MAG: aminodeoxychorismate synthase component I [Thermodesulfobacteriota bacterium]